jgi:phosphoglycolate phosphatase
LTDAGAAAGGVRAVVFDLDGTLVDSRPDLTHAVVALRAELGLAPVDERTVQSWIGEGARRLVEKAMADAARPIDLGGALDRFLAIYEPVSTRATFPYPGIVALLDGLQPSLPLGILTNKPERMTRKIVEHFGWSDRFARIVAGDTLPFRKPDPRGLLEIAAGLGLPVRTLALVGDSAIDAATARSAGARFVFAEWGFASAAEREALRGERSIRSPAELSGLLAVD